MVGSPRLTQSICGDGQMIHSLQAFLANHVPSIATLHVLKDRQGDDNPNGTTESKRQEEQSRGVDKALSQVICETTYLVTTCRCKSRLILHATVLLPFKLQRVEFYCLPIKASASLILANIDGLSSLSGLWSTPLTFSCRHQVLVTLSLESELTKDNSMPGTTKRVPTRLGTPNMLAGIAPTVGHDQKMTVPSNRHHRGCDHTANFQTTVPSSPLQVHPQKEHYVGQQGRWMIATPRRQNPGEREYKLLSCSVFSFCSST